MSNLEDLLLKRKNVVEKKKVVAARQRDLEKQIAILDCPFKLGDGVINNKGHKAVVTHIYFMDNPERHWRMRVQRIKKDKNLFAQAQEARGIDGWKKLTKTP